MAIRFAVRGQTAYRVRGLVGCQGGQVTLRLGLAGFAAFFFHSSLSSGSILLLLDVRAPIGFPPFHFRWHPRSMLISRMPGSTRIRTGNVWQPSASKPTNEPMLRTTAICRPLTFSQYLEEATTVPSVRGFLRAGPLAAIALNLV